MHSSTLPQLDVTKSSLIERNINLNISFIAYFKNTKMNYIQNHYACAICPQTFDSAKNLVCHVEDSHNNEKPIQQTDIDFNFSILFV